RGFPRRSHPAQRCVTSPTQPQVVMARAARRTCGGQAVCLTGLRGQQPHASSALERHHLVRPGQRARTHVLGHEGARPALQLRAIVPYDEIDPIFFEKTYYLGPQDGAERVYALLARALGKAGLAGVTKFVMRDRQHLGALRVRDGVITLERMYFADEVRPTDDVAPGKTKVDSRELEMATELIDRFAGKWEPERYEDTYREALCEIIKQKRKGEKVHVEKAPEAEEPADLMAALRASLEAAQSERKPAPRRRGAAKRTPKRTGSKSTAKRR
ncbi:MAG: Ku protein, partial [Gaiellaceae bacterium]